MKEIWKDIEGYEGLYQVSNLGRVKSIITNIIMKPSYCKSNYLKVKLCKNGRQKTIQIHRLVAENFIDNIYNKPQINHIDCNKENNRVDNLEWVTAKENTAHAINNGLFVFFAVQPKKRKVIQYDKEGNVLNKYNSMKEAATNCKTTYNNIYYACKDFNHTAVGCRWKYADI